RPRLVPARPARRPAKPRRPGPAHRRGRHRARRRADTRAGPLRQQGLSRGILPYDGRMPLTLLAVFLGGAAGTGMRLAADALIPSEGFVLSTLTVNVVGSFVLALLVGRAWPRVPEWMRAGLGAGLLGAF